MLAVIHHMQPIEGSLFSPFQKSVKKWVRNEKSMWGYDDSYELVWEKRDATVNRIRASEGYPVKSFRELMDEVAKVTLNNRNFEMFYRGQKSDYKNNQALFYSDRKQKTTIYPSICRPDRKADGSFKYSIKKSQIEKRYQDLENMIGIVAGKRKSYFKEFYYSLFQHYDILPTPLIDITQSLRVAATFALKNSESGYIYVLGLPYPNQSISYYTDMKIVLIKLQNVVPVHALRPRYQEGFLIGKYPIVPTKNNGDDLANRMVAKFRIDNSDGKFWDKYFQPLPDEVLYPSNDTLEIELKQLKEEFLKNTI